MLITFILLSIVFLDPSIICTFPFYSSFRWLSVSTFYQFLEGWFLGLQLLMLVPSFTFHLVLCSLVGRELMMCQVNGGSLLQL